MKKYIAPEFELEMYEASECLTGSKDEDYNDAAALEEIGSIFQ